MVDRTERVLQEQAHVNYWPGSSNFVPTDDGYAFAARYSASQDYGYPSALLAKTDAERLFPGEEFRILKRDLATGEISDTPVVSFPDVKPRATVDADGQIKPSDTSDYFIEVQRSYGFTVDTVDERQLFFPDDSVTRAGVLGNYAVDPDSMFTRFITKGANVAHDRGKAIEATLFRMLGPFVNGVKGGAKKRQVMDVIEEGEGIKTFGPDELAARGLDMDQIGGYYAIRSVMDGLYAVNNARLHRQLTGKAMSQIEQGDFRVYGRPLPREEVPEGLTHAYDLENGRVIELGRSIDDIYVTGGQIARLHSPIATNSDSANYAVFRQGEASVGPLPPNVLTYVPGYVTRFYDNPWWVVLRHRGTRDGESAVWEEAVHAVNSQAEAQRVAARVSAESGLPPNVTVEWRADRGLDETQRNAMHFTIEQNRGGIFFGRRGEKITDMEGVTQIRDPLDALVRAVSKVSHTMSHQDFIQTMKQRYANTFDDLVPKDNNGLPVFPQNTNELSQAKGTGNKRFKDAERLHTYIQHMEGVVPDSAAWWHRFFSNQADRLENWEALPLELRRRGAYALRTAGHKDIFQRMRGLTFNMFLALNPFRQIILQSQQAMYLAAIDPVYVVPGLGKTGLASDMSALSAGLSTIDRPHLWSQVKPRMAKLAGMGADEYEAMVRAFRDSGLPASIDSHTFAREAVVGLTESLSRNRWVRYANRTANTLLLPLRATKAAGFDLGELINLQTTWLIARSKWIKQNPGKDWKSALNLQEIAGDARSMALSMTRAGQLGYQKGALSLATQFASIQHKALMGMTTGKQFSTREKAGIIGSQAAFYGLAGFGFAQTDVAQDMVSFAAEQLGIELTPERQQIIMGGVSEFIINEAMRAAFDDDTNLSISEELAPAGGWVKYVGAFGQGILDSSPLDIAFGPSMNVVNRFARMAQNFSYIFNRPTMTTREQVTNAVANMHNVLSVASGYSNVLKFQAMKNMGHTVSASGDPVLEATYGEAVAKMFGFTAKEAKAYYDVLEDVATFDEKEKLAKAEQDAQAYYDALVRTVGFFDEDLPESVDDVFYQRLEEAITAEAMILNYADDDYRDAITVQLRKLMQRNVKTKKDKLFDTLTRLAIGGEFGDELTQIVRRAELAGLVANDQDRRNFEAIWEWLTDRGGN